MKSTTLLVFGSASALMRLACRPAPKKAGPAQSSGAEAAASEETPSDTPSPPGSRIEVVEDTYHGVKVTEAYRWLEVPAADEVKAWTEAQNRHARHMLDGAKARAAIEERTRAVVGSTSVRWRSVKVLDDGRVVVLKLQPPQQQPMLVVLPGLETLQPETLLFDPNARNSSTHIDWFVPSPDGRYIAVSVSEGGTESGASAAG